MEDPTVCSANARLSTRAKLIVTKLKQNIALIWVTNSLPLEEYLKQEKDNKILVPSYVPLHKWIKSRIFTIISYF